METWTRIPESSQSEIQKHTTTGRGPVAEAKAANTENEKNSWGSLGNGICSHDRVFFFSIPFERRKETWNPTQTQRGEVEIGEKEKCERGEITEAYQSKISRRSPMCALEVLSRLFGLLVIHGEDDPIRSYLHFTVMAFACSAFVFAKCRNSKKTWSSFPSFPRLFSSKKVVFVADYTAFAFI